MARPQKQTIDYFPHYVIQGKTMMVLQNEFGNDGYAFWYRLLELLCKSDGQVYDYNMPASWRLLLAETHVKAELASNILATLAELEAIDPELNRGQIIWVQNLVDNLELVYNRRAHGKPEKPVIASNNEVNVSKNRVNASKSTQTKQYNTKQEINEFISEVFDFWNSQNIIVHRNNTYSAAINKAVKDHSEGEIKTAISNYASILKDDRYYFKYKWTLKDFLSRGIDKFLDLQIAQANYSRNNGHKSSPADNDRATEADTSGGEIGDNYARQKNHAS